MREGREGRKEKGEGEREWEGEIWSEGGRERGKEGGRGGRKEGGKGESEWDESESE